VKHDAYDKEHIGDFALWKAWDEEDGDVKWDSPWGPGRPGWHIECSAMATAILGDQIDIHCGGVDNIFPHHEAEIAQSEGVTGRQFVRMWLHCAHLLVDGQKMAKSLGNFYTAPDVLAKGYTGRELRYALMRVNYRDPLNFTWSGMEEARQSLHRIDEWQDRLRSVVRTKSGTHGNRMESDAFEQALDANLNISEALGFVFSSIKETNAVIERGEMSAETAQSWLDWWERVNQTLRLEPKQKPVSVDAVVELKAGLTIKGELGTVHFKGDALPPEVQQLVEERAQARLAKDFRKSDELRDKLNALGWEARDTKDGQKITRRADAN
jgi:cysteinyl-tRNA synthetase